MKIWHQYPFVRLLIPFVAGITVALISEMPVAVPVWVFVVLTGITVIVVFAKAFRVYYKYRWVLGLFFNLTLIIAGYQLTFLNTPLFDSNNISHFVSTSDEFIAVVDEPVSEKPNSVKVIAKVRSVKRDDEWRRAEGKVILYFEKSSQTFDIEYGDLLVIHAKLQKVGAPKNPGEFDYSAYLKNKGIYDQGFVKSNLWTKLSANHGNPVRAFGIKIREKFMDILKENNVSGKEFAVASAILLGYDDYLDAGQKQAFAGAGAMHILCVSGLHVGIIYLVLNFLLAFLNRKKVTRILKVVLLLALIWFYALITGFSPSVSRAATMFSFIVLGTSMKQRSNIYNILAASAFVLLVLNPYLITQVGFQLSYIAVAGIVWIYRPLYNLFIPDGLIPGFIWRITVVSFAATFATFPLSLYYFHQFPFLFLVTNLIAIPFSMLIIYSGMLVLITSFIPPISGFFGMLLSGMLKILNFSVEFIEGLSFSTYRGVYITTAELVLIFGLTLSISIILLNRKKPVVFLLLISGLLLLSSFTIRKYESLKQQNIIVFDIGKMSVLQFTNGNRALILADTTFIADKSNYEYSVRPNLWKRGIKSFKMEDINNSNTESNILKSGNFIQFYDTRLLIINGSTKFVKSRSKINVDYIILSHNPKISISDIADNVNFTKLIFDSSNSSWKLKQWRDECLSSYIRFYDVRKKGAFIAPI